MSSARLTAEELARDHQLKKMANAVLDNFKHVKRRYKALDEIQRSGVALSIAEAVGGNASDILEQLESLLVESGNNQPLKNSGFLKNGRCAEALLSALKIVGIAKERDDSVYVSIDDEGNVQYVGQSMDDNSRNAAAIKMGQSYLRLELAANRLFTLNEFEGVVRLVTQWALLDPCRNGQNAFISKSDTDKQHCRIESPDTFNRALTLFGEKATSTRNSNGLFAPLTLRQLAGVFICDGIKAFIDEDEISG